MTIDKTKNGSQLLLSITGRLDTSTAPQLEAIITDELTNVTDLVFDFANLEYISSVGLRALLKAQKKMNAVGSMKVLNVNEAIMEVFEITGFNSILNIG